MSKVAVDVLIEIRFDANDASKTVIYTNARTDNDAIVDILSTWLQHQIGQGEDPSPAVKRDAYKVKIGLIVADDTFCTEADTGNKGLTCGLVLEAFRDLKTIPVKKLSERPEAA